MSKKNILIVEDDLELREALGTTLEIAGYHVILADCAEAALLILERQAVDMVVSDVNMPGLSGHELLAQIQRQFPGIPTMLITAFGQVSQAVAAMQAGAADYLVKPFEPQVLVDAVKKMLGVIKVVDSQQPVAADPFSKKLFQLAQKVAQSDSTVMICGESGTGKEVLARYIHSSSGRADKPFVAINCAAIPENMLEAILFGHEKGAFTGAYASAPGKFEQANGGTILLDEISEMDMGLQAKLLRVLQEREVERVGGRKTIALDVRVLATTNRDLKSYVAEGKFREDLYYRLSVFPLQWKPLRERPLDIIPIAERLLAEHVKKMKLPALSLDDTAKMALMAHDWPGNVRELDNAIQRALILQSGMTVSAADLCLDMAVGHDWTAESHFDIADSMPSAALDLQEEGELGKDLKQREFQIIIETLKKVNGRKNRAAERLGISPRTLRYKLARMRECGIDLDAEVAA